MLNRSLYNQKTYALTNNSLELLLKKKVHFLFLFTPWGNLKLKKVHISYRDLRLNVVEYGYDDDDGGEVSLWVSSNAAGSLDSPQDSDTSLACAFISCLYLSGKTKKRHF